MDRAKDRFTTRVPRTIYSLWLQGLDNAPDIVRLNLDRWARLNPDYQLNVLDQAAVDRLLAHLPLRPGEVAVQAVSDIVRACLLADNGGVWVDASVFPAKALEEWLPSHMTSSGFFAFERPGPDRPISSWFLAATADNLMMQAWWAEILHFWSVPRILREGIPDDPVEAVSSWPDTYPYFWFHYLFQRLVDLNPTFARAWAECAKISADLPHLMQSRLGQDPNLAADELNTIAALAPVHKLNWRVDYPIAVLRDIG
jgi:hypothetical protein